LPFREIDESAAQQFFNMLGDAPSIPELQERYPGIDNLMHVLTAQLAVFFLLPYLEGKMTCRDLAESMRRYLYTAFAFGVIMRENDFATSYVMELYNKDGSGPDIGAAHD